MGRSGISEYQVFQAADQLLADGIKPSVDTVRQELGNTGSRTTINNYLKAWRERQAQREHAGVLKQKPHAARKQFMSIFTWDINGTAFISHIREVSLNR